MKPLTQEWVIGEFVIADNAPRDFISTHFT